MNDELLTRDELGLVEWSVTPDPEALVPDSIARGRERKAFRAKLVDNPDGVIISHTDADGLSSAALLKHNAYTPRVIQTVGYQDAYRFEHVLEDMLDDDTGFGPDGALLQISDFTPDDDAECVAALSALDDAGCTIEWYDHHQWDEATAQAVIDAGVELTIDTDECAASLIHRVVGGSWPGHIDDLVDVTKDRDLWINDDPRSERLSVFSRVFDVEEYVETVLDYGAELPGDVQSRIDDRLERDEQLEDLAVNRAESHDIAGLHVAVTYTAGGNTSNIGNELVENHDPLFGLAVVCTPSSVSFYSHSESGTFDHCHEVAAELGGGGHPTAAGCGVPADNFRELAHWWSMMGMDGHVVTEILNAAAAVVEGSS
jgi:oligoribonuclease NrnB/cAMP/cGMP phosphodiesterase (DHH superfamily)